jgi:hypothetical protein
VWRQEPVKQVNGVDFGFVSDCLRQVGQSDQEQEDEGNRGQQRVEGQSAGKKRDVVFISGLQDTAEEAGG